METNIIVAIFTAIYVAWSIGANDETVAPLAGSGILNVTSAVILGGVASFMGAVFLGEKVENTIGETLLKGALTNQEAIIILLSIATLLTLASYYGWPISTTHSTVGAIIGLGVSKWGLIGVSWGTISSVAVGWVASPFIGFIGSVILNKALKWILRRKVKGLRQQMRVSRLSGMFLLFWVTLTSFSRGANDVGNATALLSGLPLFNPFLLRVLTGVGMSVGLMVIGRRVIQSVGTGLVKLDPITALSAQIAVGSTMFAGTLLGLPLSGTHILVGAVVGLGVSDGTWVNVKSLKEITYMWLGTFVGSAAFAATAYRLLIFF